MSKGFLQIDKSLFELGLNPTEILVLAQIMEYNRTTGDFFMSDDAMGKQFGVSSKTISRALAVLEEKKLIVRETKNVQKGKERHIKLTKDNLTLDSNPKDKMSVVEETNCPLSKGQNDLIKEKNKNINIKDNGVMNQPQAADCITLADAPKGKVELVRDMLNNSTNPDKSFKF
jgi:DNA-binding MarR family transcriptional regulator